MDNDAGGDAVAGGFGCADRGGRRQDLPRTANSAWTWIDSGARTRRRSRPRARGHRHGGLAFLRPPAAEPRWRHDRRAGLGRVRDIPLEVTVELGRTRLLIRDILDLSAGSIIELDKIAGEPVDLFANGMLVARGEVIVIDDNFGVRVTEIITAAERKVEKDAHALRCLSLSLLLAVPCSGYSGVAGARLGPCCAAGRAAALPARRRFPTMAGGTAPRSRRATPRPNPAAQAGRAVGSSGDRPGRRRRRRVRPEALRAGDRPARTASPRGSALRPGASRLVAAGAASPP